MKPMRVIEAAFALVIGVGCSPEIMMGVDLQHANARVPYQTDPRYVLVFASDVDQPYDVLSDLQITMRQRSTLGQVPTRDQAVRALQERAGKLGAHALIMVSFGNQGMSMWSYNELQGHGRAIRFR
jgi:hypothetical protein